MIKPIRDIVEMLCNIQKEMVNFRRNCKKCLKIKVSRNARNKNITSGRIY